MTQFLKYMHLERLGATEVEGIEIGQTYVFPKLDGTNAQVWLSNNGEIQCGSRNRVLSLEEDNAGFMNWAVQDDAIRAYLVANPRHTLYGEWLVPHSLKTYRDDAWRQFYVFDVFDQVSGEFLHYDTYKPLVEASGVTFLAPIAIVRNGTNETFQGCLDRNVFLIQDGQGIGEGIVIKNYSWKNKFGRVTWAKLIANHFKEKHHAEMGAPVVGGISDEERICQEFVTPHLVDKVHAKIHTQHGGWNSKMIPMLIGMVWYDLITEEMFEILKRFKNPKIDFRALNRLCVARIKELRQDLF